jgi:hypothetical protein
VELLLNIVWLLTVLLLFTAPVLQAHTSLPGRFSSSPVRIPRRYIALIILSFLLLPVISMTDDLYAMATMAESDRTDRTISAVQNDHLQNCFLIHPASTASSPQVEYCSVCYGTIDPICLLPAMALRPASVLSDRAPPQK